MIATRFRSVCWVGGVAVAALSCYLVSQRVAGERQMLARMETEIVVGERAIRSLKTEIGTRAGLNQIERWNSDVLALRAPKSEQYVGSEVQLAALVQPVQPAMEMPAAIVPVAAPVAAEPTPGITRASYTPDPAPEAVEPAAPKPAAKAERAEKLKPSKSVVKLAKAEPKRAKAEVKLAKAEALRDAAPRLRPAVFVKPGRAHQNVALLDDKLLGDIDRIASREHSGSKRDR